MSSDLLSVWWAALPDFEPGPHPLEWRLPSDEQQRAARFRVVVARQRFVLGRVMLREILGRQLEADPTGISLTEGERGKPFLAAPAGISRIYFNLSHSGDVVTLAVAPTEVGVDVESLRQVTNAERLARRFFSPAEHKLVCELDGPDRDHAFLRIWTQKEAYLKATGLGVGMAVREVETEPDPANPPRLDAIAGDRDEAGRWTLLEAEVPGAVCTVAVAGPKPNLEVYRFTPADLERRS